MADNNNHAPKAKREQWGSSFGFILATAGSAVGLGNIMKFPWMTGQYGGATFLVTYIIVMIFVGAFMLMADFLIGRNGKCSAIFAYRKIDGRFTWMGYLGVFSALLAEAYYAVFGGWMMYYIVMSFGPLAHMADAGEVSAFFGSFISSPIGPLVGALIFHILTTIIVVGGIKGGIEKASKVMMPALLVILIVLVIRALTLPNIGEGITYYLKPDLSKMSIGLVAAAVGQCFFSLNIGTTGMVNYGSYLPDSENIPSSTVKIVIADFVVAFLAGLIIIPSAFAFGIDVGSGPSLLFVTMPSLFARLPVPWLWNLLFFVLLLFASLTSSVSILEIFVPNVMELSKGKINRKKSAVLGSALCMLLGIPVSFSFGIWGDVRIFGQDIFSLYDNFICKIAYPLIALCTAVLIAWIWGKKNAVNAITNGGTLDDRFSKVWFNTVKFVCPIFLMIVVLSGFGIIR